MCAKISKVIIILIRLQNHAHFFPVTVGLPPFIKVSMKPLNCKEQESIEKRIFLSLNHSLDRTASSEIALIDFIQSSIFLTLSVTPGLISSITVSVHYFRAIKERRIQGMIDIASCRRILMT